VYQWIVAIRVYDLLVMRKPLSSYARAQLEARDHVTQHPTREGFERRDIARRRNERSRQHIGPDRIATETREPRGDEPSHTVPDHREREPRMFGFDVIDDCAAIVCEVIEARDVPATSRGLAMPALIVGPDRNATLRKPRRKGLVASAVLTEAVDDHDASLGIIGKPPTREQRGAGPEAQLELSAANENPSLTWGVRCRIPLGRGAGCQQCVTSLAHLLEIGDAANRGTPEICRNSAILSKPADIARENRAARLNVRLDARRVPCELHRLQHMGHYLHEPHRTLGTTRPRPSRAFHSNHRGHERRVQLVLRTEANDRCSDAIESPSFEVRIDALKHRLDRGLIDRQKCVATDWRLEGGRACRITQNCDRQGSDDDEPNSSRGELRSNASVQFNPPVRGTPLRIGCGLAGNRRPRAFTYRFDPMGADSIGRGVLVEAEGSPSGADTCFAFDFARSIVNLVGSNQRCPWRFASKREGLLPFSTQTLRKHTRVTSFGSPIAAAHGHKFSCSKGVLFSCRGSLFDSIRTA
jgi:hypothetical protein